jgi:ABC-type Zn uptake system ZnuABC Zn-binding protein ZnuA
MSKSFMLMLCLLTSLLILGCSTSESTNQATNTATATLSPAASPAATIAASGDKIGITECDSFIDSYEACVRDKVPEMARAQFNSTLAQWRKSWREQAANPQNRAVLVSACKQQLEAARQSMKAYNCTF